MSIAVPTPRSRVPAAVAEQFAAARGGQVSAFATRASRGAGQRCPWELVSMGGHSDSERGAVAWIIAEALMRQRCGKVTHAFDSWRAATLGGTPLTGQRRQLVTAFAEPVFKPQIDPAAKPHHGVPGHVGEWLWYLLALESPDTPARVREYLTPPKDNVNDSGGDGLVIYRSRSGTGPELLFRLWEMKKYTGKDDSVTDTVRGAWDQLSEHGINYVISQIAWADREVSGDVGIFVSELADLWLEGHPSSGAGVSVATNTSAAPKQRAFTTAHERIPHLRHDGQLEGMIVAIDDFPDFARHVQELVWTAL